MSGSTEFNVVPISQPEVITYRVNMNERSTEVIRQLNRLVNDRNLPPQVRNKIHDALQHIKDLAIKLKDFEHDQIN